MSVNYLGRVHVMSPAMVRRLHPDDRQAIFTASKS